MTRFRDAPGNKHHGEGGKHFLPGIGHPRYTFWSYQLTPSSSTGVIYCTDRAAELGINPSNISSLTSGFHYENKEWANFGQARHISSELSDITREPLKLATFPMQCINQRLLKSDLSLLSMHQPEGQRYSSTTSRNLLYRNFALLLRNCTTIFTAKARKVNIRLRYSD